MRKAIVAVLAAALMIGTVAAFAACGVNGSPKSVVRASLDATVSLDFAKMVDVMYFENAEDKDTYKEQLEKEMSESEDGAISVSGSVTKFEFSSEPVSDEELETVKAAYPGIEIEAAEKYTVTYSADVKVTITLGNVSTDTDASVADEETDGIVYKVAGNWYAGIVPDLSQPAE